MNVWQILLIAAIVLLNIWLSATLIATRRRLWRRHYSAMEAAEGDPIAYGLSIGRYAGPGLHDYSAIKREAIVASGPKTFYYLDESQVEDLHAQVLQEAEPDEMETEESKNRKTGLSGALYKMLTGGIEFGKSSRTLKKYDLKASPATKYNRIEKHLFDRNDILCGLEDFEVDDSVLQGFHYIVERMKVQMNFTIPPELQRQYETETRRKAAEERLAAVRAASGYVALQGEFVSFVPEGNRHALKLTHPVSEYLASPVSIDIACNEESLTPSGKGTLTDGSSVKITCIGKIVRWDEADQAMVVNPVAIY